MLDKLNVSKSGYYDYVNRKPSKQKVRKQELSKKIKAIHEESHEIYGAPKITVKLNQSGIKVSEKYVGNIMREMGIKAHYIRPCTITTKDSDFSSKLKNILKRNFNPEKPNSAWCTDITYIWTQGRRICVSDKYNGFILKKNNSLETNKNNGSRGSIKMSGRSKKEEKNR